METELSPIINEILSASGFPGLAVRVIRAKSVLYEDYFGYRDVHNKLKPDRDTIFYLASLTKAMTALTIGILVDEGLLAWETPVHDILPEMSRETWLYDSKLTVLDFLSHRSGVAWSDALYLQSNNNIMLAKSESIRTFDNISIMATLRSKHMYNNHAYNIAGLVIERVSGQSFGDFVKDELFDVLEMKRTFTCHPRDDNVALAYNVLQDGTPFQIPFFQASDQTMMFAGQSVRSSMGGLLRFYGTYVTAMSELSTIHPDEKHSSQFSGSHSMKAAPTNGDYNKFERGNPWNRGSSKSAGSSKPFNEVATIVRPHIARPIDSLFEQTYSLGWNRTLRT